jgi:hypothetical protein
VYHYHPRHIGLAKRIVAIAAVAPSIIRPGPGSRARMVSGATSQTTGLPVPLPRDTTAVENPDPAVDELNQKMKEWKDKADEHKRTALSCTLAIIASSALVPVVITLSHQWSGFWFGNVIPTCLAATSAIAACWIQSERPYVGWTLYRRYQHELETDMLLYRHKAGRYHDADVPARLLIERLADSEQGLQREWQAYIRPTQGRGRRQPASAR